MSVESYATLLNLKLIVPSSKSNYVAVDRNYWTHTFGNLVSEIDIDEEWYARRYKDVRNAIDSGVLKDARQHYRESGYFEHRMPYLIKVNEDWYLAQYDDVGTAISNKMFASAQEHFEELGYKEGRHPYPSFSLRKVGEAVAS